MDKPRIHIIRPQDWVHRIRKWYRYSLIHFRRWDRRVTKRLARRLVIWVTRKTDFNESDWESCKPIDERLYRDLERAIRPWSTKVLYDRGGPDRDYLRWRRALRREGVNI